MVQSGSASGEPATPRHSVAGVLQRYLPEFIRNHRPAYPQLRILNKLVNCRTPDAGLHAWQCADCGHHCATYNSCGDRHCLICSGPTRMEWLEQMKSWTLPCHYWHIVFTLPHEFNDLTAANPRAMYRLLLVVGTKALLRLLHKEFDVTPSMASMLHTWGQAMRPHYHSHNVVSCGGLSADGRWLDIDPKDPRLKDLLRQAYRKLFLKRVKRLFANGELTLPASMAGIRTVQDFDNWLSPVAKKQWMVNVQPPPAGCDGPATVIGYLGNYMSGTCIGDKRILDDDGTHVTIRIKDYRRGGVEDTIPMTGIEFIKRFVQHILPKRFRRVRYSGLWGPRKRVAYLEQCRELLQDRMPPPEDCEIGNDGSPEEEPPEGEEIEIVPKCCPRCHGRDLIFIECYRPHADGQLGGSTFPRKELEHVNTRASPTHHREAVPT